MKVFQFLILSVTLSVSMISVVSAADSVHKVRICNMSGVTIDRFIVGFASLSHEVYYPSVIRHGEPLLYGECYPKNPPSDDNFDYPLVTTGSNATDLWGYVIDYTAYNGDKYSYSNVRADGHVNITYDYANTFNPSTQRLRIVDMVTFTDPYLGAKLCSIKDWDGWIQINFNNVPWGSDPTYIDIYSGGCTVSYNYQYTS